MRPFFEPEIPAAVVVAIVHPGDDRAGQACLRQLDPGPERERVVLLEIAGIGELE